MPLSYEVRGLQEWNRKARRIAQDLHGREMFQRMERALLLIERSAKKNAPVDTGRLRNSITHSVRSAGFGGTRIEGIVGTNVEYAPYMEMGTGIFAGNSPHKMPPISALEGWARRHGANPYLVAKAIMERGGLEPRRYLQRAVEQNERRVMQLLDLAVKFIISR